MNFEWDVEKEKLNTLKHGVNFEQASYVFADEFALNTYDQENSENEDRWILLGKALTETILVVVHTFKDDNGLETIRIISARKATKKEKQVYNKRRIE